MKKLLFGLLLFCTATAHAEEPDRAAKIFTAEMAARILGEAVEPGLRNTMPDEISGKSWVSTAAYSTKAGLDRKTVTLLIRHSPAAAAAEKDFEATSNALKGTPVANLGDAAYRTDAPSQLDVRKGADWFIISAGTASEPDPALQEKTAREIFAHLSPSGSLPNE